MRIIAIGVIVISVVIVILQARFCFASDWISRCEPYREQVETILKSEAVSIDYFYLMVAESRCTEKAVSNKGAVGFWQLLPSIGSHYGCKDLHNLECSTRAAAKYIKHLQTMFKSFDDVIIAYNMGGHNYKMNKPTKQALGLLWKVRSLQNDDKRFDSETENTPEVD